MRLFSLAALAGVCILAACSDSISPTSPIPVLQFSSATPAYVQLDSPATVTTAANWDMRFSVTGVSLNGGTSGSGTVSGYCLCENATKSNAQLIALNASNTAATYLAVDSSSIPSLSLFIADSITPVIAGWVNGTTVIPTNTYVVKLASTTGAQVKFRVDSLHGATSTNPGTAAITYAYRTSSSVEFGTAITFTVTVPATGSAHIDFTGTSPATPTVTNSTTAPAHWDIKVTGYKIFVNGGASGSGGATALPIITGTQPYAAFDQVNKALIATIPPLDGFSADVSGGVFLSSDKARKWYKYNLTGNHDITPTFNTYLVKTSSGIFKVQVTSYYNTAGAGNYISIRSAKIATLTH